MNATIFPDRPAPRILVAGSITAGVNLEEYVPVTLVRNGVTYIILYSMFATLLFVLLCAVLFKNGLSPQKRRLPVVWVLGLAMMAGLLGSTLNTVFWAYQLFGDASEASTYRLWISSTSMLYVTPLITHLALQLRLMSFYPAALASRRKRIAVAAFPTIAKIARTVLIGFTMRLSADAYLGMRNGWADGGSRTDTINLCIFVLQLADTFYATCILLWKFHCLGRRDKALMNENSHWSWGWLKQCVYATAFGYVLPTLFSLALVVCKLVNINPTDLGYVLVANVYIQAFGAVLATLSRSHRWREDRFTSGYRPDGLGPTSQMNPSDDTSCLSVDAYGYREELTGEMREGQASAPVSYDSQYSLNAAELGQSRQAPSKSSEFRLKRLISGRPPSESRRSTAGSRRTRVSSMATSPQVEQTVPPPPLMAAAAAAAVGLPRIETPPPPAVEASGLEQLYTELPAGLSFEQLQKRRSSEATLISGTQQAAAAAAKGGKSASGQGAEPTSSNASTASSQHSSRPGSRGTDRMVRLGSSRSIPLSVAEEDPQQDVTPRDERRRDAAA